MKLRNILLGLSVLVILPITVVVLMTSKGTFTDQQVPRSLEEPAPLESGGPIEGEKVSLEEAQKRVPWAIPLPAYRVNNPDLAAIWVSRENSTTPKERQLYLIYTNGLEISIWPETTSPSFSNWEAPFRPLTVRGKSAVGTEPGTQQIDGVEQAYPGSVTWWENGLVINLYGNFSLAELLKVAESMPTPTRADTK